MPQVYKRTTSRGSDVQILEEAAIAVKNGLSIRGAAKQFNVDRTTLKRFIEKQKNSPGATSGYLNCQLKNMIFNEEMESELASYIKELAGSFHGLSKDKCLKLAYEFAKRNDVEMPMNWKDNQKAGDSFWLGFKKRHGLAIRSPEATSLARASAFNRHTVGEFFCNLSTVMDLNKFESQDIYNIDETGCTTVQKPGRIVSAKGVKQIGSITSAERGQLVTVINAVNAAGGALPPFLIFPRVRYQEHFIEGAPNGSDGAGSKSGWVTEETFAKYLRHLIKHTRCSLEHKILVILDNHETHVSLATVDEAKANGIVLLTIPPHTSHKLQPLDKAVYGPYKRAYARAMDGWIRSNPGKTLTIYHIPKLVNEAHMAACLPRNILAGFQSTGIYPFNDMIFSDEDFAPAAVTDRDYNGDLTGTQREHGPSQPANIDELPSRANSSIGEVNTLPDVEPVPCTSGLNDSSYISPRDIQPFPKAPPRKTETGNRRRRTTKILTQTPVRNEIAARDSARKCRKKSKDSSTKANRRLFVKNKKRIVIHPQSNKDSQFTSGESSSDINYADSDSEVEDLSIVEGDFMIVKVTGKCRMVNYIGRVDAIEGDELEGVFLKRVRTSLNEQVTFVIDTEDEAMWTREDVAKILPKPTVCGTSRRTSFQFPCDLTEWNL